MNERKYWAAAFVIISLKLLFSKVGHFVCIAHVHEVIHAHTQAYGQSNTHSWYFVVADECKLHYLK